MPCWAKESITSSLNYISLYVCIYRDIRSSVQFDHERVFVETSLLWTGVLKYLVIYLRFDALQRVLARILGLCMKHYSMFAPQKQCTRGHSWCDVTWLRFRNCYYNTEGYYGQLFADHAFVRQLIGAHYPSERHLLT